MDLVNAISKARFSAAKAQRVQLQKAGSLVTDLLCLEPGQQLQVAKGRWVYYVMTGAATLTGGAGRQSLPTGHLAATDAGEQHLIVNCGEQRLVCLAVGLSS